jgi:ribonuclease-3
VGEQYQILDAHLSELETKIRYKFNNTQLLVDALKHPSMGNSEEFQRLEFLGDAVLSVVISSYLYNNFPDLAEGDLTLYRSLIVKKSSLLEVARNLELEKYIMYASTKGEQLPKSIVADAVEALIAAIYLDSKDLNKTSEIIINLFSRLFDHFLEMSDVYDYKSILQQNAQKKGLPVPVYNLVKTSALKNKSIFEVAVEIDGKIVGYGIGRTIKEAQQNAAKNALQ